MDFYENEELIAIKKELTDTLRKNRTIDCQKRESARAKMRMMIKKYLKKTQIPTERHGRRCPNSHDTMRVVDG